MKSQQITMFSYQEPIHLINIKCLQIGIDCPYSYSIYEPSFKVIIKITDEHNVSTNYVINNNDILEFGDTFFTEITIEILDFSNPYIIIDMGYDAG